MKVKISQKKLIASSPRTRYANGIKVITVQVKTIIDYNVNRI